MSQYDKQYSIAFPVVTGRDDELFLKVADKKTAKSGFTVREITSGRPLFFTNGFAEDFGPDNPEIITDIMFTSAHMIVNEEIKNYLLPFPIYSLQIYPAVFIDITKQYHENLWFLNFYNEMDCWDRDNSEYDDEDLEEGSNPSIERFSLNTEMLDRIPEEARLMFCMGGLDEDYIFIHQKIVDHLTQIKATGIRMIPVTEFESGMENSPIGEF